MNKSIYQALRSDDKQSDLTNTIAEMILKSHLSNKAALTVDECVVYTGLAKSYIYKLTHEGVLPHSKPNGKKIFFDREELDRWLLGNRVKSEKDLSEIIEQEARRLNSHASLNRR